MAWLLCRRAQCGFYILVRTFHTGLILLVFASLVYKKTALHDAFWSGDILYCLCFMSLLVFALTMYFMACVIDPGYVAVKHKRTTPYEPYEPWEAENSESGEEEVEMMAAESSDYPVKLRRCAYCGIKQPLRSRHCEDCNRCVRKYDHHCPWLEACVGERNHKFFWLFLGSTLALIVWGIIIAWPCVEYHKHWIDWFRTNYVFLFDLFAMILGGFLVMTLFCCHSYVMCTGLTTWELMSRERITYLRNLDYDLNPFHEGYIMNILAFLCKMRTRKWDRLYRRNISRILEDED